MWFRKILTAGLILGFVFSVSAQMKVSGTIRTTDGKPVAGVTVSDGFTCVQTNAKGQYKMTASSDAYHIFYSIPSEYKVNSKDGHPDFYTKISPSVKKYDFVLEPLENKEDKFKLVVMADPQAQCMFHVKRFTRETVVDIRTLVDTFKEPYYGITLGDMAYSEGKHNSVKFMPLMREAMGYENSHVLFFQTIGNHDNAFAPVTTDKHSSTFNLAYQREFEKVFGPVNYSWNRGDVHIVSMKDIQYLSAEKSNKYQGCFTKEQYEWLLQDLKNVSREKMLILCLHVGIYNRQLPYLNEVRQLLTEFKEAHIFIGHTHFMNHNRNKQGTFEHVHAAASGAFWWSSTNGDGVPNGYTIYDVEGNHLANWQYKSTGYDISYQIRMYRGDAVFGGEYETVQFPYSHDTVLANVFMADPSWKVELYEDGVLSGEMERIKTSHDTYPEANSSRDWWAVGYHLGVIGRSHGDMKGTSMMSGGGRKGYLATCNHMYRFKLRNPEAREIKVVATDSNGNVYSQTKFTESGDYSENELMNKLHVIKRSILDEKY